AASLRISPILPYPSACSKRSLRGMHAFADDRIGDCLSSLLAAQRRAWLDHGGLTVERRSELLAGLADAVLRHSDDIAAAIREDFGHRSIHESKLADVYPVVETLRNARRHFRRWMKPRRRPVRWMFRPATGQVVY